MTVKRLPFNRLWAIADQQLNELVARIKFTDWAAAMRSHVRSEHEPPASAGIDRQGSTAVISLVGELVKYPLPGFLMEMFGLSSTIVYAQQVRAAVADEGVDRIITFVDSPGGEAIGTGDAADALFAARQSGMETVSFISGFGASAAYYIAAQSERVVANAEAIVGSIGTFMVVTDWSQAAADMGLKVHVIKAGEFKGSGVAGTEVTDEQLADFKRTVDSLSDLFVRAVARGRGMNMDTARSLNDGRVHVGKEALKMGLVDAIETWEETLAHVTNSTSSIAAAVAADDSDQTKGEPIMGDTSVTPPAAPSPKAAAPATVGQLKAELPDSTAEFRESCTEVAMTIQQAKDAWMVKLRAQCVASDLARATAEQVAADTAKQLELAQKSGGQAVLKSGGTGTTEATADPIEAFEEAVAQKVGAGMAPHLATRFVCKKQPTLRAEYVAAMNERAA